MKLIREIYERDFEQEVLCSAQPVLVNFSTSRSQTGRKLGRVLEAFAAEQQGRVKVLEVNVEANPGLGLWYGIQLIPTLLWFLNGDVRGKIVGTASKQAIFKKLHSFFSQTKRK
jgi:thioredoxin 1